MRFLILFAFSIGLIISGRGENLLQQGDFSGGPAGALPPEPWSAGKPKPNIGISIESPPGSDAGKSWVHIVDESAQDAAGLVQKFEGVPSGRLEFKLHVVKSRAAVWFLLGRKEVSGKGDMVFGFKISSKGNLLVGTDSQKVSDTSGAKTALPAGQSYELYCSFKPTSDQSGMEIEIGQKDGTVLFRGTSGAPASPVSALAIRTHGEELGSDFYVTDMVLTGG